MKKISELRANRENMSQRELADAISVTQASISRWEKNQLSISGANLIKLATYFKVSADELLGIEDDVRANN
ncbi:MAG TPA: helix-turn-helix transcriptional regulator [Atopostipes sp.]|nr:helix-turn-helix transcriptional regulator [Atopostipes sp.]